MGFDPGKAQLAVNFFERLLTHTKGRNFAKKPFLLPRWQKTIISDLFGTVRRDGLRQYATAYVEVPKKNGKSELAAGIALLGLFMDDEPGAEIYSAASTRDQAGIVFRVAAQMVRNCPALHERCKIVDSTKTIFLKDDPGSFYRAISADAGTQDGINPHFVVFDELHRQKSRDLYSVLKYGTATRVQPLMFEITTAGIEGESPVCWEEHEYARQIIQGVFKDPSFYPVIYALGEDEDWTVEGEPASEGKPATGWFKANPALGDFLRLETMRSESEKAQRLPSEQNDFRRLRLDQWVSQETRWIPLREWDACAKVFNPHDLVGKPCYAAVDLSSTQDITALVLTFPVGDEFFVVPYFWLPKDNLRDRCVRDRVPYDIWAKQELIHLTDGNYIDHGFVRKTIQDLASIFEIREVAYDPWNAQQLGAELVGDGMTAFPFRQGYASLNEPSKWTERAVLARTIRHGGHPVLRWMMDCVTVSQDPAGNIKPVKPDRLKSSKRIDGVVAMIMANGRASLPSETVTPGLMLV
jgi:phage terminase large subunit-like protein